MSAEIQVFTTPQCPYCAKVKKWLKNNNYEFEEHNVAEDQEKAREMIMKTGQRGVPQTFIGDEAVVGYRPDKIEEKIEEAR
ncbi:MAG: glutaredoxin family protein [Candidatus Nanohaloarchaea archaeon]